MQIHVTASNAEHIDAAVGQLMEEIRARSAPPDFLCVNASATHDIDVLRTAAATLGARAVHGATSCLGVMAEGRTTIDPGHGAGCLALWDPDGDYASALVRIDENPERTGRTAVLGALDAAGRPGEAPDLVWMSAAPGCEEAVIRGIESVVGPETQIMGGSCADNEIAGAWRVFDADSTARDAVVVSVLFPSRPVSTAYQNGYAPTRHSGIVTRADGRVVFEIDGQPAGKVYGGWTEDPVLGPGDATRNILAESTFHPLGRSVASLSDVPFFLLAHPAAVRPDGALELFAEVAVGERLTLMTGSVDGLTARAGRVAALAAERGQLAPSDIAGALVVYCGGCMMAVQQEMDNVASEVHQALGGAPWLGVFTFGEQGRVLDDQNRHGNLMISCVAFSK